MRNHSFILCILVLCSLLLSACTASTTNKPQITTIISSGELQETGQYPPRRIRYKCNAAECTSPFTNHPPIHPNLLRSNKAPNPQPGETLLFEDHLRFKELPIYRHMTASRYIATLINSTPAKLYYGLAKVYSAAIGTTKPPQGTLPPTASWTGPAMLRDLELNHYSGVFNASFNGALWDFSITGITSDSGTIIDDYNWKRVAYSTDTHKTIKHIDYTLNGTVHGPNHDSIAITFNDIGEHIAGYALAGVAVAHR